MLCDVILWVYHCGSALLCDTVSACTNVAVLCCVILWVPVPMRHWNVLWYCKWMYQYISAILCGTVSACTNMAVQFFLILSVPIQYGSDLLSDTVSACTNMKVLCCVILTVPVPIWQYSVVWYCHCQYQFVHLFFIHKYWCPAVGVIKTFSFRYIFENFQKKRVDMSFCRSSAVFSY